MKSNLTRHFLQSPFALCRRRSGKLALAGLLIFLWELSSVLAANPSFHKWLHHDANQNHHQCAIRLLEKHQVLSSDPMVPLSPFYFGLNYCASSWHSFFIPSADIGLSDSRAPPVA